MLCLALSLICLGSWANLQKLSGKWRYELFYWDFALGIALFSVLAAFTLGSLNSAELTFQDNLLVASYHKIAYAFGGGVLLNLGNLLLVASLSVAPMAVVFPVAAGVAFIVGFTWTLFPLQGSVLLFGAGGVVVIIAVVMTAFIYSTYSSEQKEAAKLAGQPQPSPRTQQPGPKQPLPAKGVALSVISGIILGLAPPVVTLSRTGEDGMGPYTAGFLIGMAVLISTVIFTPFFFAFAVHGAPVQIRAYFKGSASQHLYGFIAGGLWIAGLIASFAPWGTQASFQAGPVMLRGFAGGAVLLATLWGLLGWREFRGGSLRVRTLLVAMVILWTVGASMLAMAPTIGQ